MSSNEKVAVIILNWNGCKDTLECLDSVYKLQYPDFQVFVVDNGSTDNSVTLIQERFPQAVLLRNRENLGFCEANNQAVKEALAQKAGYLLMLNNDTVVLPETLNQLKSALDAHPDCAAISPLISYYNDPDTLQFSKVEIDWANGDMFGTYSKHNVFKTPSVIDNDYVNWCCVLLKKEMIERIGYLDERYFAYYEDLDWSLRCRKKGLRTALYTKVLVRHKASLSSGGEYSPLAVFFLTRNKFLFMRLHASFIRKLQFSFFYLRDCLSRASALRQKGNDLAAKAVVDAFWSALEAGFSNQRKEAPAVLAQPLRLRHKSYFFLKILAVLFFNKRTEQ